MRDDIYIDAPELRDAAPATPTWREIVAANWRRVVAWRGARIRARRDLDDLASMTERELRDIGVCLGDLPAAADACWTRNGPR